MLALEDRRRGKRGRLELGGTRRDRAREAHQLVVVAIDQHPGALLGREELVEFALVVHELRRAAGAGLEHARIEAEVEALAPGVDVERRLAAREDLHHALGRKEALLEPRAERRARTKLAPPGTKDAQVDALARQALDQALAQRRPVAGERYGTVRRDAVDRAMHRGIAGAR